MIKYILILYTILSVCFAEDKIVIKRGDVVVPVSLFNNIVQSKEGERSQAIFSVVENIFDKNGKIIIKKNSLFSADVILQSTCNRSKIDSKVISFDDRKYSGKIYSGDSYENMKTIFFDAASGRRICGDYSADFSYDTRALLKKFIKNASIKVSNYIDIENDNLLKIKRMKNENKGTMSYIPKGSVFILKLKTKD